MKRITFITLALLVLLTSCSKQPIDHFPAVRQDADLVEDWINLHTKMIRKTTGVSHPAYSRHFAYTGIALYEALVPGNKNYRSIASILNGGLQLPVAPKIKQECFAAAANTAIAQMLRYYYSGNPANVTSIDSLEQSYTNKYLGEMKDAEELALASAFGKQLAIVIFEWSKLDGASEASVPYTPRGEGFWEPTPPAYGNALVAGWGNNRTIIGGSLNGSMPPTPLPFSTDINSPFYNMVKELFDVSQSLTEEQKAIANFWDDAPNGKYISAFGHWFSILRQVLEKENASLMEAADAYLRLGISMNDATISVWKAKYFYNQLRPITYIRKYMGQPAWTSFIGTPPHPEYSAAHATISGAAAYALESVFGKNYSFTDSTYTGLGMPARSYNSFAAAAEEAGLSRLFGGIHFRPSIVAGTNQGKAVGENVKKQLANSLF